MQVDLDVVRDTDRKRGEDYPRTARRKAEYSTACQDEGLEPASLEWSEHIGEAVLGNVRQDVKVIEGAVNLGILVSAIIEHERVLGIESDAKSPEAASTLGCGLRDSVPARVLSENHGAVQAEIEAILLGDPNRGEKKQYSYGSCFLKHPLSSRTFDAESQTI
jgi:hypothetical protein